jgi:hypothetical protein
VKSCFLRWEVLKKISFAGIVAVFLVTLACCVSCVADICLTGQGTCARRVYRSVECRAGSPLRFE